MHGECDSGDAWGWIRDVTEEETLRERAAELRLSLARRERLDVIDHCAGGVAHEFKNVLQIIRGYVSFARASLPENDACREDLDNALIATDRANNVARKLMEFTRVDADSELVDLNDVVANFALLLEPLLGGAVEVAISADAAPLPIAGVDGSVRQILLNLCMNAGDAMAGGGRLAIRAERFSTRVDRPTIGGTLAAGDYARLWVTDSGIGISPEGLTQIFEPFFTTKGGDDGTGLGLAVVRQLAEKFGGAVTAESREGAGTSFLVYVPLAETDDAPTEWRPSGPLPRLLAIGVADDVVAPLREEGWPVEVAAEGASEPFDAVLIGASASATSPVDDAGLSAGLRRIAVTGLDPRSSVARDGLGACDAIVATPIDSAQLLAAVVGEDDAAESARESLLEAIR